MAKNSQRLLSLDIFRGMTVAFMIIVNTPGSWSYVYPPLRHAEWNGCTPTDLVFPFFLFIVGVSTWFSLRKYGNELNSGSAIRILRRTVTIFLLGLLLNVFPFFLRDYSLLRIMGVLQRIALAYGISAILCITINRRYLWMIVAGLLLFYWALLAFGGGQSPYSLESNLVRRIDLFILGEGHMYKGFGIPFDPEGLLSTIGAICTVITGYYAGVLVGQKGKPGRTAIILILIGTGLTGLGLLWNMLLPLNKPLWTGSYVLYTSGLAMILFAVIWLIADVLKLSRWGYPFTVFGTNALFAFFLAGLWTKTMLYLIKIPSGGEAASLYSWLFKTVFAPLAGNMTGSLLFAVTQAAVIWIPVYLLFRKKIFVRL